MRLSSTGMVVNDRFIFIYANQRHLEIASRHFGSAKLNEDKGYLQIYLSKTNLIKIAKLFHPKPNVINGQEHIENLKTKVSSLAQQSDLIRRVLAKPGTLMPGEEPLLVPHGYGFKVPPRDHQHKTFMILEKCNNINVMLDFCV
jgi:hypothetical protein